MVTIPGIIWLVPVAGIITVLFAIYLARDVMRRDAGTPEMKKVGDMIFEGAWAFMKRQYSTIGYLSILVAVIIGFVVGILGAESKIPELKDLAGWGIG